MKYIPARTKFIKSITRVETRSRTGDRFSIPRFSLWLPLALPALCSLILFAGCRSTADPFELDLTRREYFQKAIEASDTNNYGLALQYYQAFQKKFPDDFSGNLWASYEVAFSYHKMGKDKQAAELFHALLERYEQLAEGENANERDIPLGPRILAEKVLDRIAPEGNTQESQESQESTGGE